MSGRRRSTLFAIAWLLAVSLKTTTVASDDTAGSRAVRGGEKYQPQLHSQDESSAEITLERMSSVSTSSSSLSSLTRALVDDDEPTTKLLKLTLSKPVVDVSNGESTTVVQFLAQGPYLERGSFAVKRGGAYYDWYSFKFTHFSVGRCIGQRPLRGVFAAGMGCISLRLQGLFRGIEERRNNKLAIGRATVTFPRFIPPETYTIDNLRIDDLSDTLLYLKTEDLTKLKVTSTIEIRNSKVDLTPPAVVDFVATTPTTIDVSNGMAANVEFEVELEDAMFGIDFFYLVARSNGRETRRSVQVADNRSCKWFVPSSKQAAADGRCSPPYIPSLCLGKRPTRARSMVNLTFAPNMQPGNYSLELTTEDTWINRGTVNATELKRRGLVHTIQLFNRNPDIAPPTIVSLEALSPLVVNVSSHDRVLFNLTTTEDFTAFRRRNITAVHDSGQILPSYEVINSCGGLNTPSSLMFYFQSRNSSNWRKGVYKLSIFIEDLEFNNITIGSNELIANGWPGNFTVL